LAYSSALKMEVTWSSETSVDFQFITWHRIPEDKTLHNHCCENLNSYYTSLFAITTGQNEKYHRRELWNTMKMFVFILKLVASKVFLQHQ
jgi:hypothetical protein